jgi:hypothetical protein
MLNALFRPAALLACVWLPGLSAAQAADTAVSGQADAAPFEHYQGWRDEPLQDWREANQRVGEVGGWRTYLRESQQADDGGMDRSGAHSGGHMNHGQ